MEVEPNGELTLAPRGTRIPRRRYNDAGEFSFMLDDLTTEAVNPASARLDALTPLEIVRLMNAEDARTIEAVAAASDAIAEAIRLATESLRAGGRIIYVGAGTSGRLGVLDAAECPPTFNSDPRQVVGLIAGGSAALVRAIEGAEDDRDRGRADLSDLKPQPTDLVVGIATSGRTPYVLGAVEYARSVGAKTVGLACNEKSEVAALADVGITLLVGPEVLSGSTRLKAGTATKMALNMISTGAMVGIGKTYGNLMVDLRATNEKLRARTVRIVSRLTGLNLDDAKAVLDRCDGELKTAVVAANRNVEPAVARQSLVRAGGRLRAALEQG
jgi:N-acetylmuramic acid 6-phosphate etherase